jgi:hypothetical protein
MPKESSRFGRHLAATVSRLCFLVRKPDPGGTKHAAHPEQLTVDDGNLYYERDGRS